MTRKTQGFIKQGLDVKGWQEWSGYPWPGDHVSMWLNTRLWGQQGSGAQGHGWPVMADLSIHLSFHLIPSKHPKDAQTVRGVIGKLAPVQKQLQDIRGSP